VGGYYYYKGILAPNETAEAHISIVLDDPIQETNSRVNGLY
jgi:hypothetical protein